MKSPKKVKKECTQHDFIMKKRDIYGKISIKLLFKCKKCPKRVIKSIDVDGEIMEFYPDGEI